MDWQRCVGLFLEGLSLLCELHGVHVSEGRVEPLVVVPPYVPVDVRAQLFHARVRVGVYELLLDQPVGGFDHRVVVGRARPGKRTRDAEHVSIRSMRSPGEHAAVIRVEHLDVTQREVQRGECGQHKFGVVPGADRMAGYLAVCVCSIESGPCERVDVFHVSGRFWSTSACGEKRTPARPAWTSFPS